MTEDLWAAQTDPRSLIECLGQLGSSRKLRLFACACCRHFAILFTGKESEQFIESAEEYADGRVDAEKMNENRHMVWNCYEMANANRNCRLMEAWREIAQVTSPEDFTQVRVGFTVDTFRHLKLAYLSKRKRRRALLDHAIHAKEDRLMCNLLRDIFGNPFRPSTIDPTWLTWNNGTVPKLAQTVYDDRRYDIMPILADALEEAGCSNARILDHCRGPGPHVRGCWVADLILGKN